jgi:hypothetical protein
MKKENTIHSYKISKKLKFPQVEFLMGNKEKKEIMNGSTSR